MTVLNNSEDEIAVSFDKKAKEFIEGKSSNRFTLSANTARIYKVSLNSEMEIG